MHTATSAAALLSTCASKRHAPRHARICLCDHLPAPFFCDPFPQASNTSSSTRHIASTVEAFPWKRSLARLWPFPPGCLRCNAIGFTRVFNRVGLTLYRCHCADQVRRCCCTPPPLPGPARLRTHVRRRRASGVLHLLRVPAMPWPPCLPARVLGCVERRHAQHSHLWVRDATQLVSV